jgi:hypothetical protein
MLKVFHLTSGNTVIGEFMGCSRDELLQMEAAMIKGKDGKITPVFLHSIASYSDFDPLRSYNRKRITDNGGEY